MALDNRRGPAGMFEQRNMVVAIAISLAILLGFQFLYEAPRHRQGEQQAQQTTTTTVQKPAEHAVPEAGSVSIPGAPETTAEAGPDRETVLSEVPRVAIQTPALTGSLSLAGGRLDDLILRRYHETVNPDSPMITLLSPVGSGDAYYADFGWVTADSAVAVPGPDTIWTADKEVLTPDSPVTLTWDNGAGLRFERTVAVDDNYMFTVTRRVVNETGEPVKLSPYALISRTGTPKTLGYYILHEGPIGVFDGTLKEVKYKTLKSDGDIKVSSTGGWIGITDKYWQAVLIPQPDEQVSARFLYTGNEALDKYQTDYLGAPLTVPANGDAEIMGRVFAGAKIVTLLDEYREKFNIANFDLSVDFGWFYFLTKPFYYALHFLRGVTGNFGIAILLMTVAIKLLFFPLANKSYKSMAKMRKLQPKMMELRERFGDDKQRLNQEMMALYKREGANPVSGCLPIVIQIPVFFSLYKVLFVTLEMRHAPFFGWIHDLSARDPTSVLNLFGLLPWAPPDLGPLSILNLGAWSLIMGFTMFMQQKINPQPPDPMQAKIMMALPIVFTFVLAHFPAGLVIYWSWNNLLSITQQVVIMKRQGVPIGRPAKT
jgi:YidC/Oxa1 family membrane protein insertase